MIAVGGDNVIMLAQRADGADAGCFLADVKVQEATDLALLRVAAATSPAARLTAVAAGRRLAAAFRAAGFLVRPTAAELVVMSDRPGVQADLAARDWLVLAGEADADLLRRPAAAGA